MKNILEEIVAVKKKRVEELKKIAPLKKIVAQCEKIKNAPSFIHSISVPGEVSIVAEMKKASPSAGEIVKNYSPEKIAKIYEKSGARAISILTEENYFFGSPQHLKEAKKVTKLPILRKDFIFDPYQIYESKVLGASAVLLIIAILTKKRYAELLRLTEDLKMDALIEVHSLQELEIALNAKPRLVGINNRNLKDLSVNIETTFKLVEHIPKNICVVAESGIKSPETIKELKSAGVSAALIGESILKSRNVSKTLNSFVAAGRDNSNA